MAYSKTNWVNGQTPINATNLNKIENELEALDTANTTINTNNQWVQIPLTTLESDAENDRTYLYVNEFTRTAILQVYYRKDTAISSDTAIVEIPAAYRPVVGNDKVWFVGTNAQGTTMLARFSITNNGKVTIYCSGSSATARTFMFGRTTYNY